MSQAMGGKTPTKGKQPDGKFPFDFFAALAKNDDDTAMACLRAEAIPDGEVPSPRAEALMKSGEWDNLQRLALVYVEADACAGRVGSDGYRFCGKPRNYCKVGTHTKNTIGKIVRGWYVACLGKSQGVFASPYLPAAEDGGPIRSSAAARLLDEENPFRLTRGQWRFIMESWSGSRPSEMTGIEPTISTSPVIVDLDDASERAEVSGKPAAVPRFDFSEMAKALQDTTTQVFPLSSPSEPNRMVDSTITNVNARMTLMEQQLQKVLDTQRQAEEEKAENEARFRNLESVLTAKIRQLEAERGVLLQAMQTWHERLQPLERLLTEDSDVGGMTQEYKDKIEDVVRAVFGPQGPVETLKLQFSQFKDKLESDGGVTCNGVTFGSKREMLNWFDEKQPPVEIFMDALAYLHGIRSPVVYQEEATRQREAQIKTNMTNQLQVAVFTSFDTIIPSVLVGGKRMTDTGGGSIFNWLQSNIKTFEDWKPKGGQTHGVSQTIISGIGRVSDCINELRTAHTDESQAILLSVGMCTDSATFCNELVRFLSDQHEELSANSTYSEKDIWNMQLECLQKIIEELSEARGRVAAAAHFNHGYYLWGMLRAWKVQKRFLANNFKDDPSLTGIMVRRIVMQGHDTSIKDKLGKLDALTNTVAEHFRQVMAEIKKLKDQVTDMKKKKKGNNQNGNHNNNNNNEENE